MTLTLQANDIAHLKDEVVRIRRIHSTSALIRGYGGERSPMGYEPIKNLKPSSRLTLLLDDQDIARLREIRRLTFAANEDHGPKGWGVTKKALGAHLRCALQIFADNYYDEIAEDDLHAVRQSHGKRNIPFHVRVPIDLRAALFAASDEMRCAVDDLARVAIIQHIWTCHTGGAPLAAMDPAMRLCIYPPRTDYFARETMAEVAAAMAAAKSEEEASAPEPPAEDSRVSVDVLAETIAEQAKPPAPQSSAPWAEEGDGIRSATSAAAPPEKPKIRPEDVLAMRPLRPPGRT